MNEIRRERTRELYIDIVCDLIRSKGMSAVTIRNISQKAGYNSATMYSYFKNLPHLILCAQLRFEDELGALFQSETQKPGMGSYYAVWAHMYAVMAGYYMENPNIFDCAFISDFAGEKREEIRELRYQESGFETYIGGCLMQIAAETGKSIEVILKMNQVCLAQVTGMVLLYNKGRYTENKDFDIAVFEQKVKSIILCFMNEEN